MHNYICSSNLKVKAAHYYTIARKSLATFMMALLVLLTSMNYFIYNKDSKAGEKNNVIASTTDQPEIPEESENSPAGPDEKGPGNPVTISEEYLHEEKELESLFIDNLIHQLLLACSKVHPVHFELITPPPDFRA